MADPVSIGITLALTAAQVAMGAMRKIEGPRLDDRKVTLAEYGTPLPRFWGIRRFEGCPVPWAEDLREKKKKSKTKGGKYAEYKYYGTWMAVIADCEIDAVRKIYLDNHLVYQVAGTGPIAALILTAIDPAAQGAEVKIEAKNLATYLGTEDQLPDPRMEAWYEDQAEFGPNSCPAHRGTAYLVFKDIPLEKFGNRIPQVSVEAVRNKAALYTYETFTTGQGIDGKFSFGGGFMAYWDAAGQIEWWDSGSRTLLGNSPAPGVLTGSPLVALGTDGTAYGVGATGGPTRVWLISTAPLGTPTLTEISGAASTFFSNIRVFGNDVLIAYHDSEGYVLNTAHVAPPISGLRARDFCVDDNADIWILYQPDGASDDFYVENHTDGTLLTFSGTTRADVTDARFCFQSGHFFVDGDDGSFYIVDRATGTVTSSGTADWREAFIPATVPNAGTFWDQDFDEYSLEDGSLVRSLSTFDYLFTNSAALGYDPVLHAMWNRKPASQELQALYLDRIGSNGITLATIVDEVSDWVGVTADVSALDQVIRGYSVVPGTGREMIEPLLDMHLSICRTHDFGVQFIKHSTTSVSEIPVGKFVKDEARYTVETEQDSSLPREIVVTYAQEAKDQQKNTVTARRHSDAVDTVASQSINLETYVSSPDEMQQLADRWMRWRWNTRSTVANGLTAQYLAAECGDVYDLDLDGVLWSCELQRQTFSNGSIKCEWKRVFPSLNTLGSNSGPESNGTDEDEIFAPGPTKGFVLDIPLVEDVDSETNPLLYYGAGGYGVNWPGATVYDGGLDGEEYSDWNAVSSTDEATWGYATDTLADVPSPWLWDRGNTVNVKVFNGTLTTVTEAEIDADPTLNMAYLGGELINFTTATLESDGTYTLSGLKRGRRGTEWATGTHATGEDFVLVEDLFADSRGLSEVGDTMFFKAQTYGRDPEMAPAIDFTYSGASLKPYAPARIVWSTDGTDLFGEIIRRTRVGGAWTGGSTIPLSENSEAYEVDVLDGSDNVLDTIEVTGTNTFTITAAELSGYGYSLTSLPSVNVYQMSDAVGRGFALAA